MSKAYLETHTKIAKELGITVEMVTYIRPRLLSEVYARDTQKLIDKIKFHKLNAENSSPKEFQALKKYQDLVDKPNDPHRDIHERKIVHHTKSIGGLMRNLPLYEEMIKFLEAMTPEQKEILLKE